MTSHEKVQELRDWIEAHLASLQELATLRSRLLQQAVDHPSPAVARALQINRETADRVRRASRLARAQLADLQARETTSSGC